MRSRTTTTGSRTTTALPWKEAQNLIKLLQADGYNNTALMCAAGFYFGLRIGDILKLTWQQITAQSFTIIEGKTQKPRRIEVHPDFAKIARQVWEAIPEARRPKPGQLVFTSQEAGRRRSGEITVQAANVRFKKALERYGIDTGNASSHTMRKTFGRRVWEQNGRSEAALVLLGEIFNHTSIAVTRRYLGIRQEEIARAYITL